MKNEFEDFDAEQENDDVIEMVDEDNKKHYFYEEMQFNVGNERYALLSFIKNDEDGEAVFDQGDQTIARIVTNDEGEDEYFSPDDEEFAVAMKVYEELADDDSEDGR